jgi:hypothetical protein
LSTPPRLSQLALAALGLGTALTLGSAAYHTAHVALPAAMRAGLARSLGIEPAAVTLGAVRLGVGGLVIDDLACGRLAARRARYTPTLGAVLGGRLEGRLVLEQLVLEDPPLSSSSIEIDRVEVGHTELALDAQSVRVRAHDLRLLLVDESSPGQIAELGFELDRRQRALRRVAFTGLSIGPVKGLAGAGHAEGDHLSLRAAAPGARVTASLSPAGTEITVELERCLLAWGESVAARGSVPQGRLLVSGPLHLSTTQQPDAPLRFDAALRIDEGELAIPALAPSAIAAGGFRLGGHGTLQRSDEGTSWNVALQLAHEALALEIEGRLVRDATERALDLSVRQPRTDCQALLAALPAAVRRALDGIAVDGELGAFMRVHLPFDDLAQLTLDGDLDLGCRVPSEPPLADVGRLRGAVLPGAVNADSTPRRFELGPANPSYRMLEQIPARVASTFIEGEDGRFWRHRGLDLQQIRRALAHDVEIGAPGRGGSTITQQVAKNLFLSGERTFGRKLEESVLSWRLESRLGKRRILELYLNLVELGPGVYGVAEGARHWFKKELSAITADEAAQLAALLPAPRRGMDAAFQRRLIALRERLPGLRPYP